jgi:predicted acetyltransferase
MASGEAIEIRQTTPDDAAQFTRAVEGAFGSPVTDDDVAFWSLGAEWDRFLAAVEGGQIVGGAGAYPMELTLPAAPGRPHPAVSAPGVTAVGVLPTHRRRGIQRALLTRQLADFRDRGECLAILTASESVIYRRYGYGLAASFLRQAISTRHSAFLDPVADPGRVRLLDADEAAKLIPAVHDQVRRLRPGDVSRPPGIWERHFRDREDHRQGAAARFYAVHESASGEPDGYVSYRYRHQWSAEGLQEHQVETVDVYPLEPAVHAALWRYLLDLDLVTEVIDRRQPVDDPLRWRLADPRRLRTAAFGDHLWVRLVDIPAALSARGYAADGRLVLEVAAPDDPVAAGRYTLESGAGGASCRPAKRGEAADLAMTLPDLGAAYLGGVAVSTLAAAGRVDEHTTGAVARADAMFASRPMPWCGTDF